MKKVKNILLLTVAIIFALIGKASAYSADVNLSTNDKLTEGGKVEITLKIENIDATENGINVIKGKIKYDKDVFENYTLETENGWKKENESDTFLFEKESGVTSSEQVAKIIFNVKQGISKEEAKIEFTNITVSGIVKQSGGPGDIKVAGATIKVSKTELPEVTKENLSNKIQNSKSSTDIPYAGKENIIYIVLVLLIATIYIYIKLSKYKDIK